MAGTRTPYCRMLSAVSCMASSSRTLKGWSGKSCSSDSGSSVILSSCTGTEVFVLRFAVLFGSSMFVFLLIESGRNEERENDRSYRHSPMKTTMQL